MFFLFQAPKITYDQSSFELHIMIYETLLRFAVVNPNLLAKCHRHRLPNNEMSKIAGQTWHNRQKKDIFIYDKHNNGAFSH